jgi:hypothetical protein
VLVDERFPPFRSAEQDTLSDEDGRNVVAAIGYAGTEIFDPPDPRLPVFGCPFRTETRFAR